jgi:hypothetical protein
MTWLNRGFKIRHKFIKEKTVKAEAIRALELFKQQHLAKPAVEVTNEQADMVSESSQPVEGVRMTTQGEIIMREPRNIDIESLRLPHPPEPMKKKGVNFNYPDHIKPLKQRIMSALNNGARTGEAVANYCKEEVKLINMQLGRWVSRGQVGRKVSPTGVVRYYPYEIAKEMGILEEAKPINYYTKERRAVEKAKDEFVKRSSSVVDRPAQEPSPIPNKPQVTQEATYIAFLEKRIVEWQTECRKMASEAKKYATQISELEQEVIKAKTEPRNVTGEVQEVMVEVMELRATVAYLESKLFGRK